MINLNIFVPEALVLILGLLPIFLEKKFVTHIEKVIFLPLIIAIIVLAWADNPVSGNFFLNGSIASQGFVQDKFAVFLKIFSLVLLFVNWAVFKNSHEIYREYFTEYLVLSGFVLVGGFFVVSSENLLLTYIGIETMSICSYLLASLRVRDPKSIEAGIKYAIYGSVCSAFFIFGVSHLYLLTGSVDLVSINDKIQFLSYTQLSSLYFSITLILIGLGFKVGLVPMHMWTPDVYEGAPLPSTMFFSTIPKLFVFGFLVRMSLTLFNTKSEVSVSWQNILEIISVITMTVGNIAAINQRSVKRMLSYSSIANMGFLVAVLVGFTEGSINTFLIYVCAYSFSTAISFLVVGEVVNHYQSDDHERFSGLIKRNAELGIALVLSLLSLAGIPPLIGFIAKFNLFTNLYLSNKKILLVIGMVNTIISLAYYLRLVRFVAIDDNESNQQVSKFTVRNKFALYVALMFLVFGGVFWDMVWGPIKNSFIFIPYLP